MTTLNSLLNDASSFVISEFGFDIEKSQLKIYSSENDFFKQVEHDLTRFGLISQMGFPKYYDNNKIVEVFKKFYGSKIDDIDFVLLRGSQKPESDIDLFVVSSNVSRKFFSKC